MLDSNKIEYGARANKNYFCIDLFYKMKKSNLTTRIDKKGESFSGAEFSLRYQFAYSHEC